MDNYEILQVCLKKIEKKLNWGPSESWTANEFNELRTLLYESSGVYLSTSSLRRLFGKSTDYKKVYNPQPHTKDALCTFIGFKNWREFKSSVSEPKLSNKKLILIPVGTIVLLLIILLILRSEHNIFNSEISKSFKNLNKPFLFKSNNLSGEKIPHTVRIKYSIEQLTKPISVDWGDISLDGGKTEPAEILQGDSGTISHTYFNKEIHKIRLFDKDNNELKSLYSYIRTNDWECFIEQEEKIIQVDSSNFKFRNELRAKKEHIYSLGIDSTNTFRTFYRNNQNFLADGNNFSFRTDIYPLFRENYIECSHVQFEIFGTEGDFLITLSNKGCAGEIDGLYFNNVTVFGTETDLSKFFVENKKWHNLNLLVTNGTATISLNNITLITQNNINGIGSIIGIRIEFKGNGVIKNISLDNSNT